MPETLETNTIDTTEFDLEERKRLLAYQLWEEEGRPEGRSEAHWEKACLVVISLGSDEIPTTPEWLKRTDEPQAIAKETSTDASDERPEIAAIRKRIAARVAA